MIERSSGGFFAKVVADSINSLGHRLTTFWVRYPRFIHSEVMTHTVFSRNSASSRAIPFEKMLDSYEKDPALPVAWLSEQPGMSGGEELEGWDLTSATGLFASVNEMTFNAISDYIGKLNSQYENAKSHRLHKSLINRLLEPMLWHETVITSTAYDNFFDLRLDSAADENIQLLARLMKDCYDESRPNMLIRGQWHLPFMDSFGTGTELELMVSTAKVARASYLGQGKDNSVDADMRLYDRLLKSKHMSPFAHVATPDLDNRLVTRIKDPFWGVPTGEIECPKYGNLMGWQSWRHTIEARDNVKSFK